MPTVAALFFIAMVSLIGAVHLPVEKAQQEARIADVGATSMLAYRRAVIDFLNANPTFTGTVPDASLTFPWGYIRDPRWTNVVLAGSTLYVYETAANSPDTAQVLDQLFRKTLSSHMVGRKASGQLVSANGFATGISVPAAVPEGALLMVGK